jgi:hypothetical protein
MYRKIHVYVLQIMQNSFTYIQLIVWLTAQLKSFVKPKICAKLKVSEYVTSCHIQSLCDETAVLHVWLNSDAELSLQNKLSYVYTNYLNIFLKRNSRFDNCRHLCSITVYTHIPNYALSTINTAKILPKFHLHSYVNSRFHYTDFQETH